MRCQHLAGHIRVARILRMIPDPARGTMRTSLHHLGRHLLYRVQNLPTLWLLLRSAFHLLLANLKVIKLGAVDGKFTRDLGHGAVIACSGSIRIALFQDILSSLKLLDCTTDKVEIPASSVASSKVSAFSRPIAARCLAVRTCLCCRSFRLFSSKLLLE